MNYPVTPDGRYFVVRGRLWRRTNPRLSAKQRDNFVQDLMLARRKRDRARVDQAKRALGERGPTWWNGPDYNRHLAKNTPYADWWNKRSPFISDAKLEAETAVNKPKGDNARKGAVKKRARLKIRTAKPQPSVTRRTASSRPLTKAQGSKAFTGRNSVPNQKSDHGIVLDEKAQEQPKDKERAQKVDKTDKDDKLQPLREKSGF